MARHFYPRANPLDVAAELQRLASTIGDAGWEERGGFLLRDPDTGSVTGRTKWLPRGPWWAKRPRFGLSEKSIRFSEQQYAGILRKHLRLRPLTRTEQRALKHLLETAGIIELPAEQHVYMPRWGQDADSWLNEP